MATAVGAGFDISKLLDSITKADKALTNLMDKSNQASRSIVTAFQKMSSQGVMPYVQSLEKNLSVYNAIRDSITDTAGRARKGFGDMKADIDKVIVSTEILMTSLSRSPEFKFESQKKAAEEYRDFMVRMYTEMFDTIERREQQNKSAKQNSQSYAQNYQQQLSAYERLFDEAIAREDKKKKEQTDRDAKREAEEHKRKIDNINKRFDLIERRNKRDAQRQTEYLNSPKGALEYARGLDTGVKSINTMNQALQQLRNAQANVNLGTDEGRKKHKELGEAIRRVEGDMKKYSSLASEVSHKHQNLMNTGEQLKRALLGVFSVSAIKGYVSKLVEVRGEFELQHRALTVLVGDVAEANKLWDKTVQLAVKSPFAVKELVTYTKQLSAYRVESDKLYDTTKMLADISAGLGVDMNRLILAYGQVKAANYLRGTELRQFSEAGINVLQELATYFSEIEGKAVSVGDVFDRVSKRMVSFQDVNAVLEKVTGAGGQFYKMQEQQAETLKGIWMNLRDSVDLMLNDIGSKNSSILKGTLAIAKSVVDNWEKVSNIIIPLFSMIIAKMAVMKTMDFFKGGSFKVGINNMKYLWRLLSKGRVAADRFALSLEGVDAKAMRMSAIGTGISAAIVLITKLTMEFVKHRAELKAIDKEYENIRESLSDVTFKFNVAKNEGDLKKQKDSLNELVSIANKEYSLGIKIDIKSMTEEEADQKVKEITGQILRITSLAQEATKAGKGNWFANMFSDDADKDAEDYGDSFSNVSSKIILHAKKAANALIEYKNAGNDLTEVQKEALKEFTTPFDPKKETEVQYVIRLTKAYQKLNKEAEKYATQAYWEKGGDQSRRDIYQNYGISEDVDNAIELLEVDKKRFKDELNRFFDGIEDDLDGDNNQRRLEIKSVIDKQSWSDSAKEFAYQLATERFGINITPIIKQPDEKQLADWQIEYNKFVETLSTDKVLKMNANTQTEQYISLLKGTYETYAKDVAAWDAGNAKARAQYSKDEIDAIKKENAERKRAIEWLEYENKKNGQSSESVSSKISLIKEMRKEYEGLRKTFDETTSQERVMNSYAKAFKETFDGLGLSLKGKIIDDEKIEELKTSGEISEEVANKLKELSESGTHIRNFTDDAVSALKKFEGFRSEAYNIGDGAWTIGYGETKGVKKGDTITKEAANARLMKRLTDDFAVSLNKVLDANKDIIITQEQYNALLDMTYQGGSGAVSRLLDYAKNEEKAVNHINSVYEKVKTVLGENSAERFGEVFISKFKSAESIYERIAMLMQTMNLTVNGGQIAKTLYEGMQERSDARAEAFAMGKELNDIFEKAATDFSDLDITDLQGVVDFLSKLRPYAKQKGEEAVIALEKAIASYQSEIGLETQKATDKKLFDAISDIFSDYEISLEMDKLNIPPDLAEQLFGFESIDLNEIRSKVLEKFGLGSMVGDSNQGIYDSNEFKAMSKERQDELRKSLEKESELQDNALKERLKTYTQYLKKEQDERIKLKLEELRKIHEVESMSEYSPEQKKTITDKIKDDTQKELMKLQWRDFETSPIFLNIFDDLDKSTPQALRNMSVQLDSLRESMIAAGLPASDLKEILDKINQVEEELERRSPFKSFFENLGTSANIKDFKIALADEERLIKERDELKKAENMALINVETTKVALQVEEDRLKSMSKGTEEYESQRQKVELQRQTLTAAIGLHNGILASQKQNNKQLDETQQKIKKWKDACLDIAESFNEIGNAVNHVGGALGTTLEQLGLMSEETKAIYDSSMNIANDAFNLGGNIMQLVANPTNPQAWVGAITNTISLIGNIAATGDAVREKEIQAEMKKIDRLEKAYEKLEKAMEDAYTFQDRQALTADATAQLDSQIKALESANAKEEAMKNRDQDQIDANKEKIEELEEKKKELERGLKEDIGWNYDYASIADEFVDAWASAFQETGDGLKGLTDNFEKFKNNIIKKQVSSKVISSMLAEFLTWIEGEALKDYDITDNLDEFNRQYAIVAGNINSALTAINNSTGAFNATNDSELSGLQKGIQGITESQADILAAYWSNVRFDVSDIRQRFEQYLNNNLLNNDDKTNPMLYKLQSILETTNSIHTLLDSVSNDLNTAFKVEVVKMN